MGRSRKNSLQSLLIALLVNALFLALVLTLFYANYETDDDQFMLGLVSGATDGQPTDRLIYIGLAVGRPLMLLYRRWPGVPWYPLAEYATVFAAFTGIAYAFLRRDRARGLFLTAMLLGGFGFSCYTRMQFTRVAGCAAAAGGLMLLDALSDRKARPLEALFGAILLLLGSAFRYNMAWLTLAAMSALGLCALIVQLKKKRVRVVVREVAALAAVAALCLGLHAWDGHLYDRDPGWKAYREYNGYRGELLDHSFPDYDENEALYTALDITREDMKFYANWNFADPERFNLESARALAEARTGRKPDAALLREAAEKLPSGYLKYLWAGVFLATCALAVYASRKNWLWLLWTLFLLAAISAWLCLQERYLMPRVDQCVFLGMTVALMALYLARMRGAPDLPMRAGALIACVALLALLPGWIDEAAQRPRDAERAAGHRALCDAIAGDDAHVYLVSPTSTTPWRDAYGLWEPLEAGMGKNVLLTGGCDAYTPIWWGVAEAQGVENPFAFLLDNERALLLDNRYPDDTLAYLRRHYAENASAALVKEIGGCRLYRFYSGDIRPEGGVREADLPGMTVEGAALRWENGALTASATLYREGESSYAGEAMLEVTRPDGTRLFQPLTQRESDGSGDDLSGRFSDFSGQARLEDPEGCSAALLYRADGAWYRVYAAPIVA